jgi:predicted naringenin-chalcone synthase
MLGYTDLRILRTLLNSGIELRHFHLDPKSFNSFKTPDELNRRYLQGAVHPGCQAVSACLESAGILPRDVDLPLVCSCTGYLCPDLGSHLIGHVGFRRDVQRAPMLGLGCADVVPTLQRASDFARANPGKTFRSFGNMSSPAVRYVLDEVAHTGDPQSGDLGVMVAPGPGMAAEAALLKW